MMTHKERFFATIERKEVDYPASWLGDPSKEAQKNLLKYFKVNSMDSVKEIIKDDIYQVEVPYNHPPSNHIACAFDFAVVHEENEDYEERSLTGEGFFANSSDPSDIDKFNWPDPSEHMSASECAEAVDKAPDDMVVMGMLWSAHFQDSCAAFGMENALMKMIIDPDIYKAVIDRITEFYLEANKIFYEATKGKLDAVLIGNDFGSQQALMLSPDLLRQFVFSGTKRIIEQAKSYGLKVIHHSCGAIFDIIPDLIDLGADAVHPIQAKAAGMEATRLHENFASKATFCGGVDTQDLLCNGSPEDVAANVKELKTLFPTGLILSPSHEALQSDVPPANIEAMFKAIKE
jgi:uroporphyrinogen decarboxylase